MVRVTYYQRCPTTGAYSLEKVFSDVRRALPANVIPRVATSPHAGTSIACIVGNMLEARRCQGDVNHVTGDVTYLAAVLDTSSTILTIADLGSLYAMGPFRKPIVARLWFDWPIRRSRIVTVISETTGKRLRSYFPHAAQKIRVVHCPVSPSFKHEPQVFNSRKTTILQMGTGKHKNLERVIQAVAGIPCRLSIVGRPDDEQMTLLDRFNVEFTADWNLTDEAVVDKYRECDLLVFASLHEGFGLPIVEAQATGRPVVTSNLEPMTEVAGESACLVDPFDIASIRKGILRVVGDMDYRESLIEKGLRNIKRFQPSAIAKKYAQLYEEICPSS